MKEEEQVIYFVSDPGQGNLREGVIPILAWG